MKSEYKSAFTIFLFIYLLCLASGPAARAQQNGSMATLPSPGQQEGRHSLLPDSIVMWPGRDYRASKYAKWLFGKYYRNTWMTPIQVPVLDLSEIDGGLQPEGTGGGNQTISLRLRSQNGHVYKFRSVDKFPRGALPESMHDTYINKILRDQMSSNQPYAALVVPPLSTALGLYHTTPQLYYMPPSELPKKYRDTFGGMLGILEVRLDEDLSAFDRFGNSENVVSTSTMYEHLYEDGENQVDQQMYLKARMLDMVIGDWDRHEDQWRWAEFDRPEGGSLFRPVPRDRDQVFSMYDGWFTRLAINSLLRHFQYFSADFQKIEDFNLQAINLDKNLLNRLELQDWLHMADTVQATLTDSLLRHAVQQMPPEVFPINGEEIIEKMISRRNQLRQAIRDYYYYIAYHITVSGSEQDEWFVIKRLPDGQISLDVYERDDLGKKDEHIYSRTFYPEQTRELHIYGLAGDDKFTITGSSTGEQNILLRIVGGPEEDVLVDSSQVKGRKKHNIFYDRQGQETRVYRSDETRVKLAEGAWINDFNPNEYKPVDVSPVLSVDYNVDDDLYIGLGVSLKRYGFRSEPAQTAHRLVYSIATGTGAMNFSYTGNFYNLLGHNIDLNLHGELFGPGFRFNYFGQGNETVRTTENIEYYRVRYTSIRMIPSVKYRTGENAWISLGPLLEVNDVLPQPAKFLATLPETSFIDRQRAWFAGAQLQTGLAVQDHPSNPRNGINWQSSVEYRNGMGRLENTLVTLNSALAFYITPPLPFRLTLAVQGMAQANLGDYLFYQSSFLGGDNGLRGYRRTRFSGRSSFAQNTELRLDLFKVTTRLVRGTVGLLGFHDVGRVWADNEESDVWHRGFGPGLYFVPFGQWAFSASFGFNSSDTEDGYVNFNTGFYF